MRYWVFVVLVVAVSCSKSPPQPPPPPLECGPNEHVEDRTCACDAGFERGVDGSCVPGRLNTHFDWKLARGFSLFAGARATEPEIRDLYDTFRARWPHLRLTARVCGEVQSWPTDVDWLPRGVSAKPFDQNAPAFKELKHFLDVAVSIPDAQVLVVPICNLKEDGTSPANRLKWIRNTCRLIGSYPNTAIEIANEYIHPNSTITTDEMIRLIRACRDEVNRNPIPYNTEIGTDTNINERRREYEPRLVDLVDFLSYHPWRNPDPTKEDLRGIVRDRIGGTVFSETTAYSDPRWGRLGGCCTQDKGQINDYARHAEKSGGVFFYHMVWGLGWPGTETEPIPIGWILPRGDWEIRHGR